MTGFAIGLSAAALWVIVLVGVVLLIRGSSGTPQRSIRKFKGDRLAIKTAGGVGGVAAPLGTEPRAPEAANPPKSNGGVGGVAAPASPVVFQAIPPYAEAEPPTFTAVRLNSDGLIVTEDVDASEEVQEIEALVGSVTDPRAVAKAAAAAPRRTQPTAGPRKSGRITYVLVDEEGRPQL